MADSGDLVGGLLALVGIVIVAVIVIYIVILTVQVMVVGGALYGAGISLRNHALAFAHNVRPQRGVP